jgi:hypothetical protein
MYFYAYRNGGYVIPKAMLKNNLVKWLSFKGKLYNSIEAIHRDF